MVLSFHSTLPHKNAEQYINREGYFSLNTQLMVNHRGAITHLSCRWPGSVHDTRIFQESYLQNVCDEGLLGASLYTWGQWIPTTEECYHSIHSSDTDEKSILTHATLKLE